MSSDNYYRIIQNDEDGLWYVMSGFMSGTHLRRASDGFPTRSAAVEFYLDQPKGFLDNFYSEYGLVG